MDNLEDVRIEEISLDDLDQLDEGLLSDAESLDDDLLKEIVGGFGGIPAVSQQATRHGHRSSSDRSSEGSSSSGTPSTTTTTATSSSSRLTRGPSGILPSPELRPGAFNINDIVSVGLRETGMSRKGRILTKWAIRTFGGARQSIDVINETVQRLVDGLPGFLARIDNSPAVNRFLAVFETEILSPKPEACVATDAELLELFQKLQIGPEAKADFLVDMNLGDFQDLREISDIVIDGVLTGLGNKSAFDRLSLIDVLLKRSERSLSPRDKSVRVFRRLKRFVNGVLDHPARYSLSDDQVSYIRDNDRYLNRFLLKIMQSAHLPIVELKDNVGAKIDSISTLSIKDRVDIMEFLFSAGLIAPDGCFIWPLDNAQVQTIVDGLGGRGFSSEIARAVVDRIVLLGYSRLESLSCIDEADTRAREHARKSVDLRQNFDSELTSVLSEYGHDVSGLPFNQKYSVFSDVVTKKLEHILEMNLVNLLSQMPMDRVMRVAEAQLSGELSGKLHALRLLIKGRKPKAELIDSLAHLISVKVISQLKGVVLNGLYTKAPQALSRELLKNNDLQGHITRAAGADNNAWLLERIGSAAVKRLFGPSIPYSVLDARVGQFIQENQLSDGMLAAFKQSPAWEALEMVANDFVEQVDINLGVEFKDLSPLVKEYCESLGYVVTVDEGILSLKSIGENFQTMVGHLVREEVDDKMFSHDRVTSTWTGYFVKKAVSVARRVRGEHVAQDILGTRLRDSHIVQKSLGKLVVKARGVDARELLLIIEGKVSQSHEANRLRHEEELDHNTISESLVVINQLFDELGAAQFRVLGENFVSHSVSSIAGSLAEDLFEFRSLTRNVAMSAISPRILMGMLDLVESELPLLLKTP
jgi:hypothetical protein